MRIIILAAGKGTRAFPLTKNTPKPLLDIGNGVTLLEKQLENIQKSKAVDEVILVIGYLAEQIEVKLKMHEENGLKITTVYNPFYETSNNLISLWLAKHCMDDDFLITNGDNIFEPDVFADLVNKNEEGIFLTISKKNKYNDDDMKVVLRDKTVARVNKESMKSIPPWTRLTKIEDYEKLVKNAEGAKSSGESLPEWECRVWLEWKKKQE